LLIAIAFHSVNQYLQMVLQQAKKNQTPVILLTDTLGDLVGKYATATLAARRGPVMAFHSVTVPMTIINALLLALSSGDQENILSNLDKMDQLLNSFPQLNSPSQPK